MYLIRERRCKMLRVVTCFFALWAIGCGGAGGGGSADPDAGTGGMGAFGGNTGGSGAGGGSVLPEVRLGTGHTCALTSGVVRCWGSNYLGYLGNGDVTDTPRLTPTDVVGLGPGVRALDTSQASCAVTSTGTVMCWGQLDPSEGGPPPHESGYPTPIQIAGAGATDVGAGLGLHCLATATGAVECWEQKETITAVGLQGAVGVVVGTYHACAILTDGSLRCWGDNSSGELGDGTTTDSAAPTQVVGLDGGAAAKVSAGGSHTCAVSVGGGVQCWGNNTDGQLGDGTTTNRLTPVDVVGLGSPAVDVTAGERYSCAALANGAAKCWGNNEFGQLGDGTMANRLTPVDVSGLSAGVASVAAGDTSSHTCAVMLNETVKCWGWNGGGQVGDGTDTHRLTPVDVVGL